MQQSSDRKLHDSVYKDLLDKAQVHILNNQELVGKIQERQQQVPAINAEVYKESFFFKEVFKNDQETLNEENIQYNLREFEALNLFIGQRLKQ